MDASAVETAGRQAAGQEGGALDVGGRRAVARGFGLLTQTCAAALACEPTPEVLADMARVGVALGDGRFAGMEATPALGQRFFDRFVVSSTPYFVPLTESAVVGRRESDGRVRYGSLSSVRCDHVLRCYRSVGFDYRSLCGCEAVVQGMRPDAMVCELTFMSRLAYAAAGEDGAAAERLLLAFAREHARWFSDAAACLAASDDDLYARVAALAAEQTSLLVETLG